MALILVAAVVGVFSHFLFSNEYVIFIESFDHGVMTVDNFNTSGTDSKYRVVCRYGDTLTVNINPERSDKVYYVLDKLTVNGTDVTDEVSMFQYKTTVKKKMTINATFKKGARPDVINIDSTGEYISKPAIEVRGSSQYLGSLGAYDLKNPSIIYDSKSGYYFAFCSDNVVVKSDDLINWTAKTSYFESVKTDDGTLVMDFSQFESVSEWAKTHGYEADKKYSSVANNRTVLAPDVIRIGDTYYLYFSLSKTEDANESAIFCVSTNDLENSIASKQWNECGLVISTCGYHAGTAPSAGADVERNAKYDSSNAVHPSVFFGKDGKLYMAYGSYYGKNDMSGAIYLLELDEQTGLLKKNSKINSKGDIVSTVHGSRSFNAGALIARPGSIPALSKDEGSIVSAPDIVYNKESGYYYLFLTYGIEGKNSDIRVARSKDVDGPYVDAEELSLSKFGSSSSKNQYSKGLTVIAGYNFDMSSMGGVSYSDIGKASPGSPSIIKLDNGTWIMASQSQIFFKVDGELKTGERAASAADTDITAKPSLEIRQLLWTQDDWPVAVAEAYACETTEKTIKPAEMYGNWDVVVFDRNQGSDLESVACSHSQTVSIIGSVAVSKNDIKKGTKIEKLYFARNNSLSYDMLIDGVTYTVYPVVAWDWELSKGAFTFSGTGSDGSTIWGKKNFSPMMGIYTDTMYYLLSMVDEASKPGFEKEIEKIRSNPSQEQIDELSGKMVTAIQTAE